MDLPEDARATSRAPTLPPQATGFFKPLPWWSRLWRVWMGIGLRVGGRLSAIVRDDHAYLILMAAAVGAASGVAAGLLLLWIEFAVHQFPQASEGSWLRWVVLLVVPVCAGLLVGVLTLLAVRLGGQKPVSGVAGVIQAIAQQRGYVRGRGGFVTGIGTGITIGGGGSCGHEGPSIAIGAAVGSALARFFGLRLRRHVAMVGAGCAGGLAAAFNAPLAGVVFTVELVFGGSIGGNVGTMSVFVPLIVSAVVATVVAHAIHGPSVAFDLPPFETPSLEDFGVYIVLALMGGVVGTLMTHAVLISLRRFATLRVPTWLKPAIGMGGVGVLALFSNDLLGTGHALLERALHGGVVWQLALTLVVLKIIATALTVGSGGYGGVFLPSLYVGACLGVSVEALATSILGPGVAPASALVGMGVVFAAMTHAPLTPIIMLFEITQDYALMLPLMLGCIVATVVARKLDRDGHYRHLLRMRGVVVGQEVEGEVMKRGRVKDLMRADCVQLRPDAPLAELQATVVKADLRAVFVVDEDNTVRGFINGTQLARRILESDMTTDSVAADWMAKDSVYLHETDTLASAMLACARSQQDVLPVVDAQHRLLGALHRGDLLVHYADHVLGEQEEVLQVHQGDAPDQEVGLGRGLALERVIVGRAWAGRTLADLDLRKRAQVTVLEWTRDEDHLPIDPQARLREGDVVALIGPRTQLFAVRAEARRREARTPRGPAGGAAKKTDQIS